MTLQQVCPSCDPDYETRESGFGYGVQADWQPCAEHAEVCLIIEDEHGSWIEHAHFGGTADMKKENLASWLDQADRFYEEDARRWRISVRCPEDPEDRS